MNYQIANHFPAQFESGSIKEATILQCSDFVIDLQEKVRTSFLDDSPRALIKYVLISIIDFQVVSRKGSFEHLSRGLIVDGKNRDI